MNELQLVFADLHRLKRAVLKLNKDNKNKLISGRAARAILDANAARTLEEMNSACAELRWLFKFFMHREEPPDEIPDPTQSERSASVRHSGEARDRRGNLDNPNVGSQSVPTREMATQSEWVARVERRIPDTGTVAGPARPLPKRKARKSRAKPRRTDDGLDEPGEIH